MFTPAATQVNGLDAKLLESCPGFLQQGQQLVDFLNKVADRGATEGCRIMAIASHSGNDFDFRMLGQDSQACGLGGVMQDALVRYIQLDSCRFLKQQPRPCAASASTDLSVTYTSTRQTWNDRLPDRYWGRFGCVMPGQHDCCCDVAALAELLFASDHDDGSPGGKMSSESTEDATWAGRVYAVCPKRREKLLAALRALQ